MTTEAEEGQFERRLRPYRTDHESVKAELARLGFTLRGTIALRRLRCGKPSCRCRTGGKGHGPYYQITWNEGGRTVSRWLTPELVPLYRTWVSNGRELDRVVDRMLAVSRKAADAVREDEPRRATAAGGRKRHRRRS